MLKNLVNHIKRMLGNERGTFAAGSFGALALGAGTAAAAGAGANALTGLMTPSGQSGYDLPEATAAPWDAANQAQSADFASNYMSQAQAGQLPPGMEELLERIKRERLMASQQEMFGSGGRTGGSIMDSVTSMGAMGGVGPRALMAQGGKAMNDYAGRNSQIGSYIDSMKFSGVQDANNRAMGIMQQVPRTLDIPWTGQAVPYGSQGAAPMDLGVQNIDFSKLWNTGAGSSPSNDGPMTPTSVTPFPVT